MRIYYLAAVLMQLLFALLLHDSARVAFLRYLLADGS